MKTLVNLISGYSGYIKIYFCDIKYKKMVLIKYNINLIYSFLLVKVVLIYKIKNTITVAHNKAFVIV